MFCCDQVLKMFSNNMVQAAAKELKICKKQSRFVSLTWSPSPHNCVGGVTNNKASDFRNQSSNAMSRSSGGRAAEGLAKTCKKKKSQADIEQQNSI